MDKRLTRLLQEYFPTILSNLNKPITKSCMGWGIECGDGWFILLFDLMDNLDTIAKQKGVRIIASQIKEKFGGLRFYYYIEESNNTALDKLLSVVNDINSRIRYRVFKSGHGNTYNKLQKLRKKIYKSTYEKIDDLVAKAERKSYTICESCGKPGVLRHKYWMRTMCDTCNNDYCTEIKQRWG